MKSFSRQRSIFIGTSVVSILGSCIVVLFKEGKRPEPALTENSFQKAAMSLPVIVALLLGMVDIKAIKANGVLVYRDVGGRVRDRCQLGQVIWP
jgi:hypothetical protein